MAAFIAVPSAHRRRSTSTSINRRLPWLRNKHARTAQLRLLRPMAILRARASSLEWYHYPSVGDWIYLNVDSINAELSYSTYLGDLADRVVEDTNDCCTLDPSTSRTYDRCDKSFDYCVCNGRYTPSRFRTCIPKLPRFFSIDSYTVCGADTNT